MRTVHPRSKKFAQTSSGALNSRNIEYCDWWLSLTGGAISRGMGMFYKFMGGSDADLLAVFDHAVVNGSLKFTSGARFNDPFEFKFRSVAPDRDAYEAWHRTHRPDVTAAQRDHGWEALFHAIDPDLVAGVIFGARVSEALVEKALALRKARPDFTVEEVGSARDTYKLTTHRIEDNVRRMRGFL